MIDLTNIINNSNKFHYILFRKGKAIKREMFNTKQANSTLHKKMNIMNGDVLVYIKLATLNKKYWEESKKSPFQVTGGPLYMVLNTYSYENDKFIKDKPKPKNKIYFPLDYIQKQRNRKTFKWMLNDILAGAKAYIGDKLHQKMLAINNITTFNKKDS